MSWFQENKILTYIIIAIMWVGLCYMLLGKNMWNPFKLKPTTIAILLGLLGLAYWGTFYFNKPSSTALVSI